MKPHKLFVHRAGLLMAGHLMFAPTVLLAAPVEVIKAQAKMVERVVALPAELMPYEGTNLYAKVDGYVQEMNVDRGSVVKKDQVLAKLIAPEMQAEVAEAYSKVQQAKSGLAEAKATLATARITHEQLKAAAKTPGAIAELEVIRARDTFEGAKALAEAQEKAVEASEASLDAVKAMEQYLNITAPFDGQIVKRMVHTGALVGRSMEPLLRIEQLDHLRLIVAVPEQEVGAIQQDRELEFRVTAYPGQMFKGIVSRLAGSNDVKTRSMAIELDVNNKDAKLAPGMYPELLWPVVRAAPTLLVPASAVVTTTERRFVIRVVDGKAEWVDVQQGGVYGTDVEVLGSLKPGDMVVKRATDEIRVGAALETTLVTDAPAPAPAPAPGAMPAPMPSTPAAKPGAH